MNYVIACRTPWFWDLWEEPREGDWTYIRHKEELRLERLRALQPRYVFFPHWSHIVPTEIIDAYECVCFHSTPVPYGRGGSPVQNMIARGHEETAVTALRMSDELDGGPVYAQRPCSLLGGGDEIFIRIARQIVELIGEIVTSTPEPTPQEGEVVKFRRRKPAHSEIEDAWTLERWFDHIRMLDAEGYPRAFLDYGGMRIELSRPALRRGRIQVDAIIRPVERDPEG